MLRRLFSGDITLMIVTAAAVTDQKLKLFKKVTKLTTSLRISSNTRKMTDRLRQGKRGR